MGKDILEEGDKNTLLPTYFKAFATTPFRLIFRSNLTTNCSNSVRMLASVCLNRNTPSSSPSSSCNGRMTYSCYEHTPSIHTQYTCTCIHTVHMYLYTHNTYTHSTHILVYTQYTCTRPYTHNTYTHSTHVLVYTQYTCTCIHTVAIANQGGVGHGYC